MTICTACNLSRAQQVHHRGDLQASLVIVGMAPGRQEEEYGVPFVGPAGRELAQALKAADFDVNDALITNALRCNPGKHKPTREHVTTCLPHLNRDLRPGLGAERVILALGVEAWYAVNLQEWGGVLRMSGTIRWSERWNCHTVWTHHPASVLREPAQRDKFRRHVSWAVALSRGADPGEVGPKVDWEVVADPEKMVEAIVAMGSVAEKHSILCYDVETTGVDWWTEELVGIGLASGADLMHAVYIPFVSHDRDLLPAGSLQRERVIIALESVLSSDVPKVAYNGNYDDHIIERQLGFLPQCRASEPLFMHKALDENTPHGLKAVADDVLGVPIWDEELRSARMALPPEVQRLDAGDRQGTNRFLPADIMGKYCCYDTAYTILVNRELAHRLSTDPAEFAYRELDFPLSLAMYDVEREGLLVDYERLREVEWALQREEDALLKELRSWTRKDINPNSNPQVAWLLFKWLGVEPLAYTDSDQPSVDKNVLRLLLAAARDEKWLDVIYAVQLVQACRKVGHALSNSVSGLRQYIREDGKIHPTFAVNPRTQDLVKTARISSARPNMQNWPKALRPLVMAPPGYVILDADLKACEMRTLAFLSRDETLTAAVQEQDVHTAMACRIWGLHPEEVTSERRKQAKTLGFALAYGMGEETLADALNIGKRQAARLQREFFATIPDGKRYLDECVARARLDGYVEIPTGRKRRIVGFDSNDPATRSKAERQAMNSPVQSLAADVCTRAVVRLWQKYALSQPRLYNYVHDQVVLVAPEGAAAQVQQEMRDTMCQQPFEWFDMPMDVDLSEPSTHWTGELDTAKLIKELKGLE